MLILSNILEMAVPWPHPKLSYYELLFVGDEKGDSRSKAGNCTVDTGKTVVFAGYCGRDSWYRDMTQPSVKNNVIAGHD